MTKPSQVRPSSPATSLNHRLVGYSATAVAAILTAPAAHAQTVTNLTLGPTGNVFLGSGVHADSVSFAKGTGTFGHQDFTAGPLHANLFVVHFAYGEVAMGAGRFAAKSSTFLNYDNHPEAAGKMYNLALGVPIAGNHFRTGAILRSTHTHLNAVHFGNFNPPAGSGQVMTGYVGFNVGANYGWLRVQVGRGANGYVDSISFVDNGTGIVGAFGPAGITVGATAIPEPTSVATGLALFALGAVGVREHRRRRQLAA